MRNVIAVMLEWKMVVKVLTRSEAHVLLPEAVQFVKRGGMWLGAFEVAAPALIPGLRAQVEAREGA